MNFISCHTNSFMPVSCTTCV